MDFKDLTLKQAAELISRKEISATELATSSLERVKEVDERLHAFLAVTKDRAMADAKAADEAIKNNEGTALTGIPYALKDNILVKGIQATAGSKILENYKATYDATVVTKLNVQTPVLI